MVAVYAKMLRSNVQGKQGRPRLRNDVGEGVWASGSEVAENSRDRDRHRDRGRAKGPSTAKLAAMAALGMKQANAHTRVKNYMLNKQVMPWHGLQRISKSMKMLQIMIFYSPSYLDIYFMLTSLAMISLPSMRG